MECDRSLGEMKMQKAEQQKEAGQKRSICKCVAV